MPWTIEDQIRSAQAEDAHAAWWEEYTESVNDAWGDLTTLPTVITVMGNPVRLDSTGMPPWLTAATEPPDALQTANDDGHPGDSQDVPGDSPATDQAGPIVPLTSGPTAANPSTTLITSFSTIPASGTGQAARIITVVSTLVTYPSSTPPPTDPSTSSKTKTIIGVAILVGVALVVMLLIGGYILGRRTPKASKKYGNSTLWLPWPARKDGEYVESEDQKHLAPSAEDVHELSGCDMAHEMPTEVNIPEMTEVREPVELPTREPAIWGDETTENSLRQEIF